ncbi:NaeI family type II restriction endonuclease [Thioalkalivibrio sp. XN279]|uniref:NaeI family type II restriction endonuclease n=1 Tax=Thioalkalivibrio sp. XN279 TaxID=2714953 RepID=UPI00140DAE51|nr:NaeI family type II restriction endonuclease [Thioalkalivibrio sp. XN279]NHA14135.1 hypothetical protein [Thioalkalivibrio sp. XN279]
MSPDHPDFELLDRIRREVLARAGGLEALRDAFPVLIRDAIDGVVDTPRTARLKLADIEKTEKTYLGTRVEILFRDFLGLRKGVLDLVVDGVDVDIKNTIGSNWMIPTEAVGKPCILIRSNEAKFLCSLGLVVAHDAYLTVGANKDSKRSLSALGRKQIMWLLEDEPYPSNFWATKDVAEAIYITDPAVRAANERIVRLFTTTLKVPIDRRVIEGVARQKDPMKRLRKNGGARDELALMGIALLSGKYHGEMIAELGLPSCSPDQFIAYKPETQAERELLERWDHLPSSV